MHHNEETEDRTGGDDVAPDILHLSAVALLTHRACWATGAVSGLAAGDALVVVTAPHVSVAVCLDYERVDAAL